MATDTNAAQVKTHPEGKKDESLAPNEIRVGQRRSEAYVKIAEDYFVKFEEIVLGGLGNTIRTVVSAAEILKHRKYATVSKIETSMIEPDGSRNQSIAKLQITLKRLPGVKELLEKMAKEHEQESELEKHLREQEERDRDKEQDL